jgi:antitoxin MazE
MAASIRSFSDPPFSDSIDSGRPPVYTSDIRNGEEEMVIKIQKWGNSQGLRLARHILEQADLSIGDDLEVIPQNGKILLRKKRRPKYHLAELVSRMPKSYRPAEHSFGKPVGREIW